MMEMTLRAMRLPLPVRWMTACFSDSAKSMWVVWSWTGRSSCEVNLFLSNADGCWVAKRIATEATVLMKSMGYPATWHLRSHHADRCLSMELRITSSLSMHACESQLLRLASNQQPMVEVTDYGIIPRCHQCAHIQRGTHLGPSTPYRAASPQTATVPVEGRHSDQGGDLLAVQRALVPVDAQAV